LNDAPPAASDSGTAAALRRLAVTHAAPRFSVDDLLGALGEQGFGLLLLVLALPNAVPGPPIPGFSVPFALGIAALGVQLALGFHAPRLPQWMRRLSMQRQRFHHLVERTAPFLLWMERWLRPRPSGLTDDFGERLVGLALIGLGALLALPIPFGNTPIALSIIIVALGLLEGDGFALLVGLVAGFAAALWNAVIVVAGAELVELIRHFH
jgi:hypothetical protein